MSVSIKTPDEQERMRAAGQAAAEVLLMIEEHVQPGVTTEELNQICHDYIVNKQGNVPAPLGYGGSRRFRSRSVPRSTASCATASRGPRS